MAKKTLEQLIEDARGAFKDKKIVAFLGEAGCGKTVVSALLKHALFTYFIPKNKGNWEAVVSGGYEVINNFIIEIKQGNFPDPTLTKEQPRLIIDVYSMEGAPTKIELILKDMSGENYTNYLAKEYPNIEDQLNQLLTYNKTDEDLAGPLAHLVFAKMYVIMIDCKTRSYWDTDPSRAGPMISTIKKMKEYIHKIDNEKIHNPIAIIFTKADLLDEIDAKKSPEELMKDYPELASSLRINHDGPVGYFKLSVKTEIETKKDAENRVKKMEIELQKEFELKLETNKRSMELSIEKAVKEAETLAVQSNYTEDQKQTLILSSKQKIWKEYEEILHQQPPSLENKEKLLEPRSKVKIPLQYSDSEYVKFIAWIVDKLTR